MRQCMHELGSKINLKNGKYLQGRKILVKPVLKTVPHNQGQRYSAYANTRLLTVTELVKRVIHWVLCPSQHQRDGVYTPAWIIGIQGWHDSVKILVRTIKHYLIPIIIWSLHKKHTDKKTGSDVIRSVAVPEIHKDRFGQIYLFQITCPYPSFSNCPSFPDFSTTALTLQGMFLPSVTEIIEQSLIPLSNQPQSIPFHPDLRSTSPLQTFPDDSALPPEAISSTITRLRSSSANVMPRGLFRVTRDVVGLFSGPSAAFARTVWVPSLFDRPNCLQVQIWEVRLGLLGPSNLCWKEEARLSIEDRVILGDYRSRI